MEEPRCRFRPAAKPTRESVQRGRGEDPVRILGDGGELPSNHHDCPRSIGDFEMDPVLLKIVGLVFTAQEVGLQKPQFSVSESRGGR